MPSQIINGQSYEQYTPAWYKAQQDDTINRAGVAGTAEGTGEANYLSKLSPTLAGLYSAVGSSGGTSTAGRPSTVGYPSAPGGGGGSTANPAQVSFPTGGSSMTMSPTATIAPLDLSASDAAAFANAKDQAGQTAGASMTGLSQALAGRGMGGAGYEAGQIGSTLSTAANTIGSAGRAKAVEDANLTAQGNVANLNASVAQRGQDIGQKESQAGLDAAARNTAYSGGITQRGQDIGTQEAQANREAEQAASQYSGAITQRGQDIGQAENAADLAQRQAQLKSQQTLAILQSVLGGGKSSSVQPGYVY